MNHELVFDVEQGYSNLLFRGPNLKKSRIPRSTDPHFSALFALNSAIFGGPLGTLWQSGFWTAVHTLSTPDVGVDTNQSS